MEPSPTILVVDDVPLFRELECLFLARCGRVITACERVARPSRSPPRERPAVVVLDAHLPDVTGEEMCRRLKGRRRSTPIVVDHGQRRRRRSTPPRSAPAPTTCSRSRSRAWRSSRRCSASRASPMPRGLPRVTVTAPVRIVQGSAEAWGTARNLSRGGMFVECDRGFAEDQELDLEFQLPGRSAADPADRARGVERGRATASAAGFGVRFLSARRAGGALPRRVRPRVGAPGRARLRAPRRGVRRAWLKAASAAGRSTSARRALCVALLADQLVAVMISSSSHDLAHADVGDGCGGIAPLDQQHAPALAHHGVGRPSRSRRCASRARCRRSRARRYRRSAARGP